MSHGNGAHVGVVVLLIWRMQVRQQDAYLANALVNSVYSVGKTLGPRQLWILFDKCRVTAVVALYVLATFTA